MINLVSILLLTFQSIILTDQDYKPVVSEKEVIQKLKQKSANLTSLSADFEETVYSSVLTNSTTTEGKVFYEAPNKVRWEKTSSNEVIIINHSNVIILKDGKEIDSSGSKRMAKRIQSLLIDLISSNFIDQTDFSIQYEENDTRYRLTLVPSKPTISKYISHIDLILGKSTMELDQMSIYETPEDFITYHFKSVIYNAELNQNLFN